MSDQHERTALVGRGERRMEIARHADAVVGTILVVAPDNSGTTIGASPREFCHLTLDLRPAERAEDAKSRFEYDRRAASTTAINLDTPAADIDEPTRYWKIADSALAFNLFPNRTNTNQKCSSNCKKQACCLENSSHGSMS